VIIFHENASFNRIERATTYEIIETSHREKGWIENHENRTIIDYSYGFDLALADAD